MNKKKLFSVLKVLGNLLMVASIVFIGYSIYSMDVDYSQLLQPQRLLLTVLFALLICVTVIIGSFGWGLLLQFLAGKKVHFSAATPVYTKANMGKYLPGNFMHYANRNLFGVSLGLSQLDIAFSSVLEVLFLCITAVIWSVLLAGNEIFLQFERYFSDINPLLIVGVAIVLVVAACVVIFLLYKKNKAYLSKLKRFLSPRFLLLALQEFGINSVNFAIPGITFVMVLSWNDPSVWGSAFRIVSVYIIAWVVGFIVPGAPGGIGVREAVLTLLLFGITNEANVLVAVIIQRLITIIADIFAYIAGTVYQKMQTKKGQAT